MTRDDFYPRFSSAYRVTTAGTQRAPSEERARKLQEYVSLADRWAGATFESGLYRIHDQSSLREGMESIAQGFPSYVQRVVPFAFDWLGRQFAIDFKRQVQKNPLVLMFEPGTGEVLEIPYTLLAFHEELLIEDAEPALATSFFQQWAAARPSELPQFDQCIGYRVPLFLNGRDGIDNLERVDRDVYWSVSAQILAGTLQLPRGKTIREVTLGE
jgi:hypothetical protein